MEKCQQTGIATSLDAASVKTVIMMQYKLRSKPLLCVTALPRNYFYERSLFRIRSWWTRAGSRSRCCNCWSRLSRCRSRWSRCPRCHSRWSIESWCCDCWPTRWWRCSFRSSRRVGCHRWTFRKDHRSWCRLRRCCSCRLWTWTRWTLLDRPFFGTICNNHRKIVHNQ